MAIPQILQQLGGSQIKQMMDMVRTAGDPQAMLNRILQSNPQYQQINQLINQAGGDPRKAFYDLARQRGVDPNDVLNMLK